MFAATLDPDAPSEDLAADARQGPFAFWAIHPFPFARILLPFSTI